MFPSETTVDAVSSQDALQQAAVVLCAPEAAIEITKVGKKQYAAKITRCDARIRILVSENRLEARAEDWGPAVGGGNEFTLDSFRATIEAQGVNTASEKAIYALWNAVSAGRELPRGILARGIPPKEAINAKVELSGNPAYPVFNEERFGRKIPPKPAEPGMGVDKLPVAPSGTEPPTDLIPREKCGWDIDKETLIFTSKTYGQVIEGHPEFGLYVQPWLRISKSRLRIHGAVHHLDFQGKQIDVNRMAAMLKRIGVTKAVRKKAIAEAINEARKNDAPATDVILAQGISPHPGKDGRLELTIPRPEAESDDLETLVINPRERSVFTSVGEGSVIGHIIPPVPGVAGMDVYGQLLPPEEGVPCQIKAGENVELTGENEFKAQITGVVVIKPDTVNVLDMLEIRGDVDYKTGNVELEKGLLKVSGSITEGFKVHSPEDVVVRGVLENGAQVESGGNVEVGGGILTGDEGYVRAKGSVACQFMENAKVKARGDVKVKQNISNCRVKTLGVMECTQGKGVVQGGHLTASKGIVVNEAGSEAGVATHLEIVPKNADERIRKLEEQVEQAKARAEEITKVIGTDMPQKILARTPPEKRDAVNTLIKERMRMLNRAPEIGREIEEINRQIALDNAHTVIKVLRQVHPGVTFSLMGKSVTVHEPKPGCTVSYNPATNALEVE